MVVLGIVLGDLLLFGVLPLRDGLVKLGLYPPLLALNEPGSLDVVSDLLFEFGRYGTGRFLSRAYICLARLTSNLRARRKRSYIAEELSASVLSIPISLLSRSPSLPPEPRGQNAYQRKGVEALGVALGLEHQTKLADLSLLLGSQVAGVALHGDGRGGRVVIVVVLGIELHVGGCGGCRGKVGFGDKAGWVEVGVLRKLRWETMNVVEDDK